MDKIFNFFNNKLNDQINELLEVFIGYIKLIVSPVEVEYSNILLAQQINDISILLFMLSVTIIVLIACLVFNTLIVINIDKLLNYFKKR